MRNVLPKQFLFPLPTKWARVRAYPRERVDHPHLCTLLLGRARKRLKNKFLGVLRLAAQDERR
jgi:hypothetical protein